MPRETKSIFGHAVELSLHPGRFFLLPFFRAFEKHYAGKYKFERAVFVFDLVLMGIVITLFTIALFLILIPTKQFSDDILFRSRIAPKETMIGAPSTIILEYKNNTREILHKPSWSFVFPKNFVLASATYNGSDVAEKQIALSDIPVGGTGTVHLQGVLLGHVNEEQTFQSTLTFTHEPNVTDSVSTTYAFTPKRSILSLQLHFPHRLMHAEQANGVLTYKNSGAMDLRDVRIKPVWPEGFTFQDANAQITNGEFVLPYVKAGSSGTIQFSGMFSGSEIHPTFSFEPRALFGKNRFALDALTTSIDVFPSQLKLTQSLDGHALVPGSIATFRVHYKHTGTDTLENVLIGITSKNPFLTKQESFAPSIKTMKPGDEGDLTFTIPIRDHVDTSLLTAYENVHVRTHVIANYTIAGSGLPSEASAKEGDPAYNKITITTDERSTLLTTPLVVESFARYTSPGGDQIGRGPLPPRIGQKTRYWIFWHVDETTNEIEHPRMEGVLPENVSFTGNNPSSEDSGVIFDPVTRKISWSLAAIPPTLNPLNQIYGTAFEVSLTPTSVQIGSPATLLKDIRFTATDNKTGISLSSHKPDITTNLPDDQMAKNKGVVQQ